jgi:uncharacterized protein YkwD
VSGVTRRGTLLTIGPFIVVFTLAAGLTLAALLSMPRPVPLPTASTAPEPTALAVSPSPEPPATPLVAATPSVTATPPAARSNESSEMLRIHNELRVSIGAPTVRSDDRVTAAAQRHAEYLARNRVIGHEETPGEPGFTGASVRDRLAAQGYHDATASEVATGFSSGTDGVRSLWVLPYHRLGMMHPHTVVAGWGHADIGGRTATVGVLVYDFAAAGLERVRSPISGHPIAGSWHGEESPDVLPAGAARPVGYPVMVVYGSAKPVELRIARVSDANGRELAHHVVPQLYERDYVAIVPAAPLAAGARYRVRLELTVAGAEVIDEWEFETER